MRAYVTDEKSCCCWTKTYCASFRRRPLLGVGERARLTRATVASHSEVSVSCAAKSCVSFHRGSLPDHGHDAPRARLVQRREAALAHRAERRGEARHARDVGVRPQRAASHPRERLDDKRMPHAPAENCGEAEQAEHATEQHVVVRVEHVRPRVSSPLFEALLVVRAPRTLALHVERQRLASGEACVEAHLRQEHAAT